MRMGVKGEGGRGERKNGHGRQKNQMVSLFICFYERERERERNVVSVRLLPQIVRLP